MKGLSVTSVTSNTDKATKAGVSRGDYSLVYFTPELLLEERRWRELLQKAHYIRRIKAFIVDEAHCVKKW